jgi:hypothetical protein
VFQSDFARFHMPLMSTYKGFALCAHQRRLAMFVDAVHGEYVPG